MHPLPCAGKAGCSPLPCMLVCILFCANRTRDRGCSAHPVFPAPSVFEGKEFLAKLGRIRPREREVMSNRHSGAREARARNPLRLTLGEMDSGPAPWRSRNDEKKRAMTWEPHRQIRTVPMPQCGNHAAMGTLSPMAGITSALIRAKEPWGWGVPGIFSLVQSPWVCS